MPVEELVQWRAFEKVFGPITVQERVDAAAASIAHWLVAIASRGTGVEIPDMDDFLPIWDVTARPKPPPEQTPEQMMAMVRSWQERQRRRKQKAERKPRKKRGDT